jgi:hypothetical protein
MPEKVAQGWFIGIDEEHDIPNVTPAMIDWWWDNMEKGYPLWHPTDHKSLTWEVAPADVGHVGAIQINQQRREGGFPKSRTRWEDVSACPVPILYEHVLVGATRLGPDNKPGGYLVHQYEAASYGTHHRFTTVSPQPRAQEQVGAVQTGLTHPAFEALQWSQFLPEMYKMWQMVKDPAVNVPCNLKVKKLSGGRYAYVVKNLPPKR